MVVTKLPQFWRGMKSNNLWECQKKNAQRKKNLVAVVEISKVLKLRSMLLQDRPEEISLVSQVKVIQIAHLKHRRKSQNLRRRWSILEKLIKQMIVKTLGKSSLARNLSFRSTENLQIASMAARDQDLTIKVSFRALLKTIYMTKFKKIKKGTTSQT